MNNGAFNNSGIPASSSEVYQASCKSSLLDLVCVSAIEPTYVNVAPNSINRNHRV